MNWFREDLKWSTFTHSFPPDGALDTTNGEDSVTKRGAEAESPEVPAEIAW